jgi:hypothetical protein
MAVAKLVPGMFIGIEGIKGFNGWYPMQETVNGQHFMAIQKRDRGLGRLVLKHGMVTNRDTKNDINLSFMDELQCIRTRACDAAVQKVLQQSDEPDSKRTYKQKTRRAKPGDKGIAPKTITITVPPATLEDGTQLNSIEMQVLFGCKCNDVYVEMTAENIDYIVKRLRNDLTTRSKGRGASSSESSTPKKRNASGGMKHDGQGDDDPHDEVDDDTQEHNEG